MDSNYLVKFRYFFIKHKVVGLIFVFIALLCVLVIIFQLIFFADGRLPFNTVIDGQAYGGWQKLDAMRDLDNKYQELVIGIELDGEEKGEKYFASLDSLGISARNNERLGSFEYPWSSQLIPGSSLWWASTFQHSSPKFTYDFDKIRKFIFDKYNKECSVKSVNAGIVADGKKIKAVYGSPGMKCDIEQAFSIFYSLSPNLEKTYSVVIPTESIPPTISNDTVDVLVAKVNSRLSQEITIEAPNKNVLVAPEDVVSWLDFIENEEKISASINAEKFSTWANTNIAPLVNKPAGVTRIIIVDNVETSRQQGAVGKVLDKANLSEQILKRLVADQDKIVARTNDIAPKVEYQKSYSGNPSGISAMITNFAATHAGTYSVKMIEIGGRGRVAEYNAVAEVVSASTYKFFVAWGAIRKIEAGEWYWTDLITSGKNLDTCFYEMIAFSNEPCAVTLLGKYGRERLTSDIRNILGLSSASGFHSVIAAQTSAADLAKFLQILANGNMFRNATNTNKLINAMHNNIFRSGIPAGVSGVPVADKVGFIWGYKNDAGIVYSSKGTYVLVIMTNNSNWANIAELTRQIEALR